jgi:hypothetical protein
MHVSELTQRTTKERKMIFDHPETTPSLIPFSCVHRQNYKTEDNEGSKDSEESIEAANFLFSVQLMSKEIRYLCFLLYQKSRGTRGDDSSSAGRVNANRYVHSHARLEVRNRPFLSVAFCASTKLQNRRADFPYPALAEVPSSRPG